MCTLAGVDVEHHFDGVSGGGKLDGMVQGTGSSMATR